MKIIKLSFLALYFVSFISCSTDEDSPAGKSDLLTGTWTLMEFEYDGYSDSVIDGMPIHTSYAGVAENINASITFHENGTFDSQGVYDIILTGEGMTIPYRDLSYASSGNYKILGNTIDITNFEGESTPGALVVSSEKEMTIVELTPNRLVLDFTEDVTISEDQDEAFISNSGRYILNR